jgi:hypothetical protein
MKTMLFALGYFALCAVLLVLIGIFYVTPIVAYNLVREKLRPSPVPCR